MRKTNVNGARIKKGEFIVQIITDSIFSQYPHQNCKKTKQSSINYPVVSIAAMHVNEHIRIAFSGICNFPFRSNNIEAALNDASVPVQERINRAMGHIPDAILDDMHASGDYRKFVLEHELKQILEEASA